MQKGVKDTINFPKSASKKVIVLSVFLLMSSLLLTQSFGQCINAVASDEPQLVWSRTYGPYRGNYVTPTEDGGYFISGTNVTRSIGTVGFSGIYALHIKTNSNGGIVFAKTYYDDEKMLWQINDNGYLDFGRSGGRPWIMKTDADGNVQWNKTIPVERLDNLVETSDGGFLSHFDYLNGSRGIGVINKLDSEGNLAWNKTIIPEDYWGLNFSDDVIETDSGDFIFIGSWNNMFWLGKFDSAGNWLVNKTYSRYDSSQTAVTFKSIIKASDGNYVISGVGFGMGNEVWLFKVDEHGTELWHQSYSFDTYPYLYSITETKDGGYFAVGGVNLSALFLKTDSFGNAQWNATFTEGESTHARSVIATEDSFVVTGQANESEVWLAKFSLPVTVTPTPSTSIANNLTYFVVIVIIFVISLVGMAIWQLKTKKPI